MASVRSGVRLVLAALLFLSGLGFSSGTARARAGVARKDQSIVQARRERAAAFAALRKRLQDGGGQVRVIVRLNTDFTPEADLPAMEALDQRTAIDRAAGSLEAELGTAAEAFESLDRLPIAILVADAQALTVLQNSPRVLSIQEDVPEQMQLAESTALIGASGTFGAHAAGYTGAGYAVAILDVGVDKLHPFLSGRVVAEACFSTSYSGSYTTTTLCPNGQSEQHGTDAARPCSVNNLDPLNACDHGTHVAGIAAAGNPAARLMAVRITFDFRMIPDVPTREQAEREAAAARATVAYLKQHGVRVVNMSWGGSPRDIEGAFEANGAGGTPEERRKTAREYFQLFRDAMTQAMAEAPEILFVAAAGNSDNDASFAEFVPSGIDLPNILTVGAVDQAGEETSFSSFGKNVDVHANGFEVDSTLPGGERMKYSGTSMASPNVANLAAKLLAVHPGLNVDQVIQLIKLGTDLSPDGRIRAINPKRSFALLEVLRKESKP